MIILLHSNSEMLKSYSEIDSEKQDFRSLRDLGSLNPQILRVKEDC